MGCSGGIGGDMRTTSLLVDDSLLIDAGTGVGDLSFDALMKIDHIFVTHTHLDHIACIPLLLDTVMGSRHKPVTLHASKQAIIVFKEHIFNWMVWPNFNCLPDVVSPLLIYEEMNVGDIFTMDKKTITALPSNHVVPSVGYQVNSGDASLVFTGDTAGSPAFWREVNKISNLKYLIIETAFANAEAQLAKASKHLCPQTLASELKQLNKTVATYITHLKPGEGDAIMQEISLNAITKHCAALNQQQVFEV